MKTEIDRTEQFHPHTGQFISAMDCIIARGKLIWTNTNHPLYQEATVEHTDEEKNHFRIEFIRDNHSVGHRRIDITYLDGSKAYMFIDTHSVDYENGGGLKFGGFNGRFSKNITSEQYDSVLAVIKSLSS
ncbi:MAG: hypothetical protein H6772_00745 [Pseudomonadales bacterium]|nr:hypothetical protein [Pseudomonadales bacterium]